MRSRATLPVLLSATAALLGALALVQTRGSRGADQALASRVDDELGKMRQEVRRQEISQRSLTYATAQSLARPAAATEGSKEDVPPPKTGPSEPEVVAHLEGLTRMQARDRAWGDSAESQIAATFSPPGAPRLLAAKCFTTFCRIEMEDREHDDAYMTWQANLTANPPFTNTSGFVHLDETIPNRRVMYVAREGQSLMPDDAVASR